MEVPDGRALREEVLEGLPEVLDEDLLTFAGCLTEKLLKGSGNDQKTDEIRSFTS